MSSRRLKFEPKALAIVAGVVAALVLAFLSVRALSEAGELQGQLNRMEALSQANKALTPYLLSSDRSDLGDRIDRLIHDSDLGLTYLAVSDVGGAILGADGRFEDIAIPLLSQLAVQQLRAWLYRVTSTRGEFDATVDGQVVGRIEYALAPGFAEDIREKAISELKIVAWSGMLLGLPTLAALALVMIQRGNRSSGDGPAAGQRDQAVVRTAEQFEQALAPPEQVISEGAEPGLVEQQSGMHTLDLLGRGLIVVDSQARIRFMNGTASEITGWSAKDAQGRLVYSIFHPLDDQKAPLITPAEICLRENCEYESTDLWVRARDAKVHAVEVMAARLRTRSSAEVSGVAMVFHRIDERRSLIDELKRQARISLNVIDHLVEGVVTTDAAGIINFANARALRMFGYVQDELNGKSLTKLLPVPFLNMQGINLTDYIAGRHHHRLPKVVGWRKDTTTFAVELLVQPMSVDGSDGLVVILRDISERLQGENLAQRLGRLLDAAAEEIYIFDAQSLLLVEVNRGARENLGYQIGDLRRLSMLSISQELESQTFNNHLNRLRGGDIEHVSYRCKHVRADGTQYPVEVRVSLSREEEPPVFLAIAVDVTEREAEEHQLRYVSRHDPLTGLVNRDVLLDRLEQALLSGTRSNQLLAVFSIEPGAFEGASGDAEVGETVFKEVARRISELLREADTIARFSKDEFVVLAPGVRSVEDAEGLAQKFISLFSEPVYSGETEIRVAPNIGLTLSPMDQCAAEELLRHANAAMHESKQEGAGRFKVFDVEILPETRRRLDLEQSFHAAFAMQQFDLEASPVYELRGRDKGPVIAVLVDAWWQHHRSGRVADRELREVASQAGLLGEMELWQLQEASSNMPSVELSRVDNQIVPVVLRLSGWQLRNKEFASHVQNLMEQYSILPRQIVFSLDAAGYAEAGDANEFVTRRLRQRGIRFALQDSPERVFSSLGSESSFALEWAVIELPESPSQLVEDEQAVEVMRLAVLAAKGKAVPVVVRGIASEASLSWLQQQGCQLASGEVLSAPVTLDESSGWLSSQGASASGAVS